MRGQRNQEGKLGGVRLGNGLIMHLMPSAPILVQQWRSAPVLLPSSPPLPPPPPTLTWITESKGVFSGSPKVWNKESSYRRSSSALWTMMVTPAAYRRTGTAGTAAHRRTAHRGTAVTVMSNCFASGGFVNTICMLCFVEMLSRTVQVPCASEIGPGQGGCFQAGPLGVRREGGRQAGRLQAHPDVSSYPELRGHSHLLAETGPRRSC